MDITDESSIRTLYESVGKFDAVVNTVGVCEYAPFTDMTDEQWTSNVMSKHMGQIKLVKIGTECIRDNVSFTLITGILNVKPISFAVEDAVTSGAIDTFVKVVAFELPRGIRFNSVNPTVLASAWDVYRKMMPGF
ncbi:SDR family oxidoreductase [Granulosicoccus sp. 3-233]|uniref:SDR family oxidoreductase n=1 Tax=Granulosicoccus sp. 3-233 TaxID=3417969 RepID=UPI003D34187C